MHDKKEETELSKEVWHKTKGISITVIILLIVNIVSTVWWAATLTNDVSQLKSTEEAYNIIVPELTERVIRLEAVTEEYNSVLSRLVNIIDRLEKKLNNVDKNAAILEGDVRRLEKK